MSEKAITPQKIRGGVELPTKKVRNSNLELLRILAMLVIICAHFVFNSGVRDLFCLGNDLNVNTVYLQFFGMWGKVAINTFVIISGYFMCMSKLTVKRISKIYLEAKFYGFAIFIIFFAMGLQSIGLKTIVNLLFGFIRGANNGFTSSFIVFYLFIPFYNKLIESMNEKTHRCFIIILSVVFSLLPTILFNGSVTTEICWYMVLYFVASYIRIYPLKWMKNNKICVPILLTLMALSCASILVVDILGVKFGFDIYYYLLTDSYKILAFAIGIFSFLVFNNFKMPYNKFINTVASTTFGVLCIHANGDTMREVLWNKIVDVKGHFYLPLPNLILFSVAVVISIFVVCSLIDLLRINILEKPLFKFLDKYKWFNKPIIL